MFTKNPQTKIKKIVKLLSQDLTNMHIDQVVELIEFKFNVGVGVNYGRLQSQSHELEIYRKFKGEWLDLIARIECEVQMFKQELDC